MTGRSLAIVEPKNDNLQMPSLIQSDRIQLVSRHFARAAGSFDDNAVVFQQISERLLGRLELLAITPDRILDLGSRTGYQLAALQRHYPKATVVGVDPAATADEQLVGPSFWRRWHLSRHRNTIQVTADPHRLPFVDGQFDLVVSNLLLPWCRDPRQVFREVHRVLNQGGAFLMTSAGPDTLLEYRALWAKMDSHLHVFGLLDMHDVGDAMLAAGFAAPVLDRENMYVDYPSVAALQTELRRLGAANIALGRRSGLMSSTVCERLNMLAPAGRFKVTLELIQGHGWKGDLPAQGQHSDDGYTIPLDSIRRTLGSPK